MGERASKYLAKYLKERYDVVKLRREVAEELKEFAKSKKLTLSDAVSYLLASARALRGASRTWTAPRRDIYSKYLL